jgi:hypothetical protein
MVPNQRISRFLQTPSADPIQHVVIAATPGVYRFPYASDRIRSQPSAPHQVRVEHRQGNRAINDRRLLAQSELHNFLTEIDAGHRGDLEPTYRLSGSVIPSPFRPPDAMKRDIGSQQQVHSARMRQDGLPAEFADRLPTRQQQRATKKGVRHGQQTIAGTPEITPVGQAIACRSAGPPTRQQSLGKRPRFAMTVAPHHTAYG